MKAHDNSIKKRLDTEFYKHKLDAEQEAEIKLQTFDSLISHQKGQRLQLLFDKAIYAKENGMYPLALSILSELKDLTKEKDLSLKLKAMDAYAETLFLNGDMVQSYLLSRKILDMDKHDSLYYYDFNAYQHLQHIMMRLGLNEFWESSNEEALSVISRADTNKMSGELKRRLIYREKFAEANLAISKKQYDEALTMLLDVLKMARNDKEKSNPLNGIGVLFSLQGDFEKGRKYFIEALDKSGALNRGTIINNYLLTLYDEKKYKEFIDKYLIYRDELSGLSCYEKAELNEFLGKAYVESGDESKGYHHMQEAIADLKKGNSIREEIFNLENLRHHEDALEKTELETGKTRLFYTIIVLLIIIIASLSYLVLRAKKSKQRDCREILRLENLLKEKDKRISEEKERRDDTIEQSGRELTLMTMHMAKVNKALDSISKEIASIPDNLINEHDRRISKILREMSQQDDIWEMFRLYFERCNHRFFEKLYRICPDLTSAEIRMCAFSLLGMSVKEIATMSNRSVRTVEAIRYTLRKKLGIKENTDVFMRRVAGMDTDDKME